MELYHGTHSISTFILNDGLAQSNSLTLVLEVTLHVLYPSELASALLSIASVLKMNQRMTIYNPSYNSHRPSNALTFGEICTMLPVSNADERHANQDMHYRISC